MKKPASLLKIRPHFAQKEAAINQSSGYPDDLGYTLIELLVVTIIIGVLAAIAAPGWLGFVNQRRVSSANEVVFRALQEAQNLAKSKKLSYSVAFATKDDVPAIAIYQKDTTPSDAQWRSLGKDLALKKGQIWLGTNLKSENEKDTKISYSLNPTNDSSSPTKKITFDYLGAISPAGDKSTPLVIQVGVPNKDNSDLLTSTVRCVKVTTLLGALKTGKGTTECKS